MKLSINQQYYNINYPLEILILLSSYWLSSYWYPLWHYFYVSGKNKFHFMDLETYTQLGRNNLMLLKQTILSNKRLELKSDISTTVIFLSLCILLLALIFVFFIYKIRIKNKNNKNYQAPTSHAWGLRGSNIWLNSFLSF